MTWGLVRSFFYIYFSAVTGLMVAWLIFVGVASSGRSYTLPAGGWPLVIIPPLLILGSLVSTQANHFGQRISLVKWVLLCLVPTLILVTAAALSL